METITTDWAIEKVGSGEQLTNRSEDMDVNETIEMGLPALNISSKQRKNKSILSVENTSDKLFDRLLVKFRNGYSLSIVRGTYSYGGDQGLFEIGPINKELSLDGSMLDAEDRGDDVLGYLTKERVSYYIEKIGNMV